MMHPLKLYYNWLWMADRSRLRRIEKTIRKDFDPAFYRETYPDVRRIGVAPIRHYILKGWKQNKDPNALFSTREYIAGNRDVATAGINPFLHYVEHGRAEGRRSGFSTARRDTLSEPEARLVVPAPPKAPEWEAMPKRGAATVAAADGPIDVIIPVYKGLDYTAACLKSVLMAGNEHAIEAIVVNDRSPDEKIAALLDRLARSGHITLLTNSKNLGFVESVNRGMAQHPDRHVILLNSDAMVFDGYADRLARPIETDPRIATVTPLSNNATICSYPDTAKDNDFELELPAERLDALALEVNGDTIIDVPTGVGFCMLINREALNDVGGFDAQTFGIGYGEENDFCMRALKRGWRNVMATGTYVRHFGSVSFGDTMDERSGKAQRLLAQRHPDYHSRVRRYFSADPGLPSRILIDAARLREAIGPVSILYLTHNIGGGIETYFQNSQSALEEAGQHDVVDTSVIARIHHSGFLGLEPFAGGHLPYTPNLTALNIERHQQLLPRLFDVLDPKLIHVNSFAGLSTHSIQALINAILRSERPFWHVWHDHQPLCPRVSFIDSQEQYCGESDASLCYSCLASTSAPLEWVDIFDWREMFSRYLGRAEKVIAPTEAAAERARRIAPAGVVEVHPHPEPFTRYVGPLRRQRHRDPRAPRKIAMLGAIGPHKGANLIAGMADDAETRKLKLLFEVVGYTSLPSLKQHAHVRVHGRYAGDDEAVRMLRRIRPEIFFMSSIWPETYVFTISVAMALGLPIVAFDLGAQGERVGRYARGHLLDPRIVDDPAAVNDALLALDIDDLWARPLGDPGFEMTTPLSAVFDTRPQRLRSAG